MPLKVYISSTYEDLKEYRKAVYDALRKIRADAIAMEDYVAQHQRSLQKCLEDVASSDMYVGIFAWRYGYIPNNNKENPDNLSITELEYRKAKEKGIPCLIFLLKNTDEWPLEFIDGKVESGKSRDNIIRLRNDLKVNHTISFFKTPADLVEDTITAIFKIVNELKEKEYNKSDPLSMRDVIDENTLNISYTVIDLKQIPFEEALKKIATAINLKLSEENQNEILPFTPSDEFEGLKQQNKIFLYGDSGSGKSRTIYEITKNMIKNVPKIFVINPQNTEKGHKSERIPLHRLIVDLAIGEDIIIWDNFPSGLSHRDRESAKRVLELISGQMIKGLLIGLNPQYLTKYKDISLDIPDIFSFELRYSKRRIKEIILSYGNNITRFNFFFNKFIKPNIEPISKILWKNDPLPLTILDYYKEFIQKYEKSNVVDIVSETERWPGRKDYYKNQFYRLNNSKSFESEIEFLHTLKLSYQLGLSTTLSSINKLQKEIFDKEAQLNLFTV